MSSFTSSSKPDETPSLMLEARGMVTLGGSKWGVAGGYFCSSKVLFLDLEGVTQIYSLFKKSHYVP